MCFYIYTNIKIEKKNIIVYQVKKLTVKHVNTATIVHAHIFLKGQMTFVCKVMINIG